MKSNKSTNFDKETINKFVQTQQKYNTSYGQGQNTEYKNQFHAKQSFKKLYSNQPDYRGNSTKSWKINKRKILKESYFRAITAKSENIFSKIETRLDLIAYRLGWAKSLNEAQNLIRANVITRKNSSNQHKNYHKWFVPVGSIIEFKHKREKRQISNKLNYLLLTRTNNIEQVTLLRSPTEKEVLRLWLNDSGKNKHLILNIMLQIDKLYLQT